MAQHSQAIVTNRLVFGTLDQIVLLKITEKDPRLFLMSCAHCAHVSIGHLKLLFIL